MAERETGVVVVEKLYLDWEVEGAERARVQYLRMIDAAAEQGLPLEAVTPQAMLDIMRAMLLEAGSDTSPRELMHVSFNSQMAREVLQGRLEQADAALESGEALDWTSARSLLEQPIIEEEVVPVREQQREGARLRLVEMGHEALIPYIIK